MRAKVARFLNGQLGTWIDDVQEDAIQVSSSFSILVDAEGILMFSFRLNSNRFLFGTPRLKSNKLSVPLLGSFNRCSLIVSMVYGFFQSLKKSAHQISPGVDVTVEEGSIARLCLNIPWLLYGFGKLEAIVEDVNVVLRLDFSEPAEHVPPVSDGTNLVSTMITLEKNLYDMSHRNPSFAKNCSC